MKMVNPLKLPPIVLEHQCKMTGLTSSSSLLLSDPWSCSRSYCSCSLTKMTCFLISSLWITHLFLFPSLRCLPYISASIQQCKWTSLDCTCFYLSKSHAWLNVITSLSGGPYGWWTVKTLNSSATPGSKSSPVAGSPCAHCTLQCPHTFS